MPINTCISLSCGRLGCFLLKQTLQKLILATFLGQKKKSRRTWSVTSPKL